MDFKRESFPFHRNWYNAIRLLDDEERLELYDIIMQKAFFSSYPQPEGQVAVAMSFIEPEIEHDTDKWLDISEKRKKSGQKGGLAKATKCYQMLPNATNCQENKEPTSLNTRGDINIDNNLNINIPIKEKKDTNVSSSKKEKGFIKPTIEEIQAYIQEKGYSFDAEAFFAFYESKGWMIGKNHMKNWRMACTTWSKSQNQNGNNYGRAKTNSEKFVESVAAANEFSQKLRDNIGKQTELDFGDNSEVW